MSYIIFVGFDCVISGRFGVARGALKGQKAGDFMEETAAVQRVPKVIWRLLKLPAKILYALGLGPLQGRFVLLLTTVGRKSGLARVTPLQYDEADGNFYVGSARGVNADWYRNILANPEVEVRVKSSRFHATAEPITDPGQIADLLELRLKRRPRMVGAMLRAEGYPSRPSREQLEAYAKKRAMVVIRPLVEIDIDEPDQQRKG